MADYQRVHWRDDSWLVLIPAGMFLSGDPPEKMELPSFYLAQHEVTNAQYKAFLAANQKARRHEYWDDERFNLPQQPVVGVSWHEALAYCEWAGLRLPTELEWEKGARGTDGRIYPWGKKAPDKTRANFAYNVGRPTTVGNYPAGASPYGLMDMAGNVLEWTASLYERDTPGRVLRGGAFDDIAENLRAAVRIHADPDVRNRAVGFRCAKDF